MAEKSENHNYVILMVISIFLFRNSSPFIFVLFAFKLSNSEHRISAVLDLNVFLGFENCFKCILNFAIIYPGLCSCSEKFPCKIYIKT